MNETAQHSAQDALRDGLGLVAPAYHGAQTAKVAEAMINDMDAPSRTEAATIARLVPDRKPDIAIWFGTQHVTWRAAGATGLAPNLDVALSDIRATLISDGVQRGDGAKNVQDRIINTERAAGRAEPEMKP